MTQGFNGDSIIEWLLGWFKALFNDLLALFSGSEGSSLLRWLAASWRHLLVTLVIIGVSANLIIYFVRWRPHWWWFGKKRPVIDDKAFMQPKKPRSTPSKRPSSIVPVRQRDLLKPKRNK